MSDTAFANEERRKIGCWVGQGLLEGRKKLLGMGRDVEEGGPGVFLLNFIGI